MEPLDGRLLIANGSLYDPNFRHTVILVAEHSDEGAFGVVLNRPAPVMVAEAAPALVPLVGGEERLFTGGPVQPSAAVVLADFERPELADPIVFDTIGLLTKEGESFGVEGVRAARVYAGFAGWGPGQLEMEIEESSWIIEPAMRSDVFTDDPRELWGDVLRRKGGRYALLSTMPFDPSRN
jgi:putative transcriptional regulator